MRPKPLFSETLRILVPAVLAVAVTACGPAGGRVDLQLDVLYQDLEARGAAAEPGTAPAGIDAFRLCVQTPDGRAEECRDFLDLDAGTYRIDGLPVGSRWVVTFQGYRAEDSEAVWCGRARGVEIKDGKTTPVRMLLTRCGDFTRTVEQPEVARVFHTASTRADGRVLVAGGFESHAPSTSCDRPCQGLWATAAVEIYDHADGSFAPAEGELTHARGLHAAMALSDGRLLVAGGCEVGSLQSDFSDVDRPGSPLGCIVPGQAATTAEVFDPASGESRTVEIPATIFAVGVAVDEDEMLLLGGEDEQGIPLRRALRIVVEGDQIQVFPIEQALTEARRSLTAVVFSSPGDQPVEILVLGGTRAPDHSDPGNFAERMAYQAGSLQSVVPRFVTEMYGEGLPVMHASGARSGPGQVLVSGGVYPARFLSQDVPFEPEPLATAASVDLRLERLKILEGGSQLLQARAFHTSTAVDRLGHVLVTGGMSERKAAAPLRYEAGAGVEWWDSETEYFSLRWVGGSPAEMEVARAGHTATLLLDGNVLLVGGTDGQTIHSNAEMFNPAPSTLESDGLPPL